MSVNLVNKSFGLFLKILMLCLLAIVALIFIESHFFQIESCEIVDKENELLLESLEPDTICSVTTFKAPSDLIVFNDCDNVKDSLEVLIDSLNNELLTTVRDTEVIEFVEKINLVNGKRRVNRQLFLFLHCTATRSEQELTAQQINNIAKVRFKWNPATQDYWKSYHYIVLHDGTVHHNYVEDLPGWISIEERSAGAAGWNHVARHAVYVGGVNDALKPKDTRNDLQKMALANLVNWQLSINPDLRVVGHYSVTAKACPSFNVKRFAEKYGIDESRVLEGMDEVEKYYKEFKKKDLLKYKS